MPIVPMLLDNRDVITLRKMRSLDAVIHSPAVIVAACPTIVTTSRCPRTLARRTQKPFSALWYVMRSTRPARTSWVDVSGVVFISRSYHELRVCSALRWTRSRKGTPPDCERRPENRQAPWQRGLEPVHARGAEERKPVSRPQ